MTHQHRDTSSSIVGHPALLQYLSIADGEATARTKFELTEVSGHVFFFPFLSFPFLCGTPSLPEAFWTRES